MKNHLFPNRRIETFIIIFLFSVQLLQAQNQRIFFDDFKSTTVTSQLWHIPTWVSSTDGTYLGRTQMRVTQNSGLPEIADGKMNILLETFNPSGFSFYGTDLITNRKFSVGNGLILTIRAKMAEQTAKGYVGGIFLYDLTGTGTEIHDEIDFELLTNRLTEVQTNIYGDEPFGAGHPEFKSITGSVSGYHTYMIKWLPGEVTWLVDGNVVRTTKLHVPDGTMHFHLNIWAPAAEWAEAYDASLQPVSSLALNKKYSMLVDSVQVDSMLQTSSANIHHNGSKLSFCPNPARDFISFDTYDPLSVSIYDLNGRLLLNHPDFQSGKLPVGALPRGVYILSCEQKGSTTYNKLILN